MMRGVRLSARVLGAGHRRAPPAVCVWKCVTLGDGPTEENNDIIVG